jgi:hypothetical protein
LATNIFSLDNSLYAKYLLKLSVVWKKLELTVVVVYPPQQFFFFGGEGSTTRADAGRMRLGWGARSHQWNVGFSPHHKNVYTQIFFFLTIPLRLTCIILCKKKQTLHDP